MAMDPADDDDDDGEWRFSLEDIEDREADPESSTGVDDEPGAGEEREGEGEGEEDTGGNIAGSFRPAGEIEAGDIDAENALFVLVGVALAVLAIAGFMNILP